ncbi:MAG: tRNA pseudouridine(55) synthase TruB, partial [Pseudomonadota bacterium]
MSRNNSAGRIERRDVHGILLLDKPHGLSSNQALQRVRYLMRAKKAGHTGSLDPLATGMLPLCFGDATRFSQAMLDADKTYEVVAELGRSSSTGDAEGEKSAAVSVPSKSLQDWQRLADQFVGDIQQIPPMYSALKQDGKRLYELARAGKTTERKPRPVKIHALTVNGIDGDQLAFTVTCSKGTYIRTLVEDVAKAAGTLAWTHTLHRLSVAPFQPPMYALTEIEAAVEEGGADALLLGADAGIRGWPSITLSDSVARSFCLGQASDLEAQFLDELGSGDTSGELVIR